MLKFIDKLDIVKALKISAVVIFALHFVIPSLGLVVKIEQQPYDLSIKTAIVGLLSILMNVVTGLFQPLVLLALAELIRIKKGNKS